MEKIGCYVCDTCRHVCYEAIITIKGKKRKLHFCSTFCLDKYLTQRKNGNRNVISVIR